MRLALYTPLALLLASCASQYARKGWTVRLTDDQVAKIVDGMTERELRDAVGPPWQIVSTHGLRDRTIYRYVRERAKLRTTFHVRSRDDDGQVQWDRAEQEHSQFRVLEVEIRGGRVAAR